VTAVAPLFRVSCSSRWPIRMAIRRRTGRGQSGFKELGFVRSDPGRDARKHWRRKCPQHDAAQKCSAGSLFCGQMRSSEDLLCYLFFTTVEPFLSPRLAIVSTCETR
jgi:hypothetical protein